MNYQETLDYLYNQLPVYQHIGGKAYKEGLDNSLQLDAYFEHPHTKYKTIHVAGTNGKGSTSHLLAAVLQQAGYKVGLYTSPHLVDFRERIRVNGEKISQNYVINFVEKHRKSFEPIQPSFFELTMMMAFLYFAEENVDVAIIEVGLGGRLDSTNIITPDLSVITNISFDHTNFLGDTLEKIAREKAGIIKKNIPVVVGEAEGDIKTVFENKARDENTPIYFAEDFNIIKSYRQIEGKWVFDTADYPNLICELGGYAQLKNVATVITALRVLKNIEYTIPDNAVYSGFENVCELTGLMGRWQILQNEPKVICDTGHNIGGMQYIAEQLDNEIYENLYIVLGMVNDKDITNVLSILPKQAFYYFTQANIARAMDASELMEKAKVVGLKGVAVPVVTDAVNAAIAKAEKKDLIFIGGSNFVVGEALTLFLN